MSVKSLLLLLLSGEFARRSTVFIPDAMPETSTQADDTSTQRIPTANFILQRIHPDIVNTHHSGHSTVLIIIYIRLGRLGSRVVSALDSGAEGPGFKSQSRRCRVTVLGKLFTPIVPLFTKQRNW